MKKFFTFLFAICLVGLNVFGQDPENPEKIKKPVFHSGSGSVIPGDIISAEAIIVQEDILDKLYLPDRTHNMKVRPFAGEGSLDGDNSYVSEEDSLALVAFYNSTNGDSWIDNTNWLTGPVNSWYGVDVSTGRITQISMESNNLTGSLPLDIGELTDLTYLSLAHNAIGGVIPVELSSLYNLYDLILWDNQLTGSIPAGLGSLTNLIYLDLSTNQLTGSIPTELGNLASLNYLWLSNNQLSGSIPPELGNLSKLYEFVLYYNQLSGAIPAELGNLTDTYFFVLSDNQLSGAIPEELGNLVGAAGVWLWLHNNQLTGVIPSSLGNVSKMYSLSMYSNQLSGIIPPELGNLSILDDLLLNENQLSGSIPPELGNLLSLGRLKLSANQLSGSVPPELGNLSSMGTLDLYDNQLTDLPDLSTLTSLTRLLIHNNHFDFEDFQNTGLDFTGLSVLDYAPQLKLDVPSETVSGSDIILTCATSGSGDTYQWFKDGEMIGGETSGSLTISNSATGVFKCEVYNSTYPSLTLSTKSYFSNIENSHGIVKEEYDALVALYNSTNGAGWTDNSNWLSDKDAGEWYGITTDNGYVTNINLAENNLTGPLPSGIGSFEELKVLNLGLNTISGTIPAELFDLVSLEELTLWDNQLTGGIPDGIEKLANLIVLDFDANQLTGNIPAGIGSLSNLQFLYLSINQLSGSIPPELGNLNQLQVLWSWGNQLSGSIPPELGNMSSLVSLTLSLNQLNGSIPAELGNLSNLNYLSLNRNQLSGAIPAELGNLSNLQYIYLYENQLTGSIPDELYNLGSLKELWIRENNLEGTISPNIQNLSSLEVLQIRTNNLSGTIPTEIGSMTNLIVINLSQTTLEGAVPASFNDLANLQSLFLYETNLSQLPLLSSLSSLTDFYTNESRFTFEDFITTGLDFNALIGTVVYAPQATLALVTNAVETSQGTDLTLNCQDLTVEDLWSTNNEYAVYKGGTLVFDWSSDPEFVISSATSGDAGEYTIQVRNSAYPDLILLSDPLQISVTTSNQSPTDISLSVNTIDEDRPSGSPVGTFSATDPDAGDTHTYSLATGDGTNDADNSSFVIEGGVLKTAVELNYETKSEYLIFVQTEDAGGLTFEKAFTVTVNDVAETGMENAASFHAEVYPNPSSGKFMIRTSEQALRIEVYNTSGQKVVDQMVDSELIDLDMTGYSSGIYYLKIDLEKRTYQTRLVKL